MAELRPHVKREAFLATVRAMEPDGFRLAFIREGERVVAVAGYRVSTNLFYGKHLYVDDLVTTDAERSKGHGRVLLAWLRALAVEKGCDAFDLDSGEQRRAPRLLPARRDGLSSITSGKFRCPYPPRARRVFAEPSR